MTEQDSKKYLRVTLALLLLIGGGLATVNYTIDPYGIYRDWKEGDVFPASDTYERIHKTERIKRVKPDVLLLGMSRANLGVDPDEEFFPKGTAYNAAVSAATIYEHRRMLELAHAVKPLKKVILALDFISFNTMRLENRHFEEKRVGAEALAPVTAFLNTYGTIFSFDTLSVSVKHLRYLNQIHRQSFPEANGHKMNNKGEWMAKKKGVHSFFLKSPNTRMDPEMFSYKYSDVPGDTSFQHYRAILDFCKEKNIDLVVFIGPLHKTHLEMFKEVGLWDTFLDWKKTIVEISRPYGVSVWDFATYNSITTEPLPPEDDKVTQMRWFWDTDHYKTEAGDIILRKLYGLPGSNEYPGFGEKLQ